MRTHSLFLSALVVATLAGCIDEPEPVGPEPTPEEEPARAVFADATDARIAEAFQASFGMGMVYLQLAQFSADLDARAFDVNGHYCPSYEEVGQAPLRARYDGGEGCTTALGVTYEGSLEATNPLQGDVEFDGGAMAVTAEGFAITDVDGRMEFDGSWSQTASRTGADGHAVADLRTVIDGMAWEIVGGWTYSYEGDLATSTCDAGLRGSVDGLGAFEVSCELVGFGTEDSAGWFEIVGEDVLRIDADRDENGCYPVTVDGVPRAPICGDDGGQDPDPEPGHDVFYSLDSMADVEMNELAVSVQTHADRVARVDVALATDDGDVEVHTMAIDDGTTTAHLDGWRVGLQLGATYEPQVSTALGLIDLYDSYQVVFAYDDADALLGCWIAGADEDAGPIDVSACN